VTVVYEERILRNFFARLIGRRVRRRAWRGAAFPTFRPFFVSSLFRAFLLKPRSSIVRERSFSSDDLFLEGERPLRIRKLASAPRLLRRRLFCRLRRPRD
jgi:hypothetical protein